MRESVKRENGEAEVVVGFDTHVAPLERKK